MHDTAMNELEKHFSGDAPQSFYDHLDAARMPARDCWPWTKSVVVIAGIEGAMPRRRQSRRSAFITGLWAGSWIGRENEAGGCFRPAPRFSAGLRSRRCCCWPVWGAFW